MPAAFDLTRTAPRTVLMVIANPSVSTTLGWPVGFWGSELSHPYYEFAEVGYQVTVASPQGGRCELDAFSDPRHESGYSAEDLITMGFLSTPSLAALLDDTSRLADLDYERYDAIVVCGGQAPMFTFRDDPDLQGRSAPSTRPRSPRPRSATAWRL
jgi:putative intracellular protease/amidase